MLLSIIPSGGQLILFLYSPASISTEGYVHQVSLSPYHCRWPLAVLTHDCLNTEGGQRRATTRVVPCPSPWADHVMGTLSCTVVWAFLLEGLIWCRIVMIWGVAYFIWFQGGKACLMQCMLVVPLCAFCRISKLVTMPSWKEAPLPFCSTVLSWMMFDMFLHVFFPCVCIMMTIYCNQNLPLGIK